MSLTRLGIHSRFAFLPGFYSSENSEEPSNTADVPFSSPGVCDHAEKPKLSFRLSVFKRKRRQAQAFLPVMPASVTPISVAMMAPPSKTEENSGWRDDNRRAIADWRGTIIDRRRLVTDRRGLAINSGRRLGDHDPRQGQWRQRQPETEAHSGL